MEEQKAVNPPFDLVAPGKLVEGEQYNWLYQLMQQLFKLINPDQANSAQFVGAQPVSMSIKDYNMILLHKEEYLLCEKTDGVRYLMIIDKKGNVYLHGR